MVRSIDKINLESGIYCIIHRDSLMCYVGSSVDMGRRRRTHILSAEKGGRTYVHRVIREFGENAFDFEVLEYCNKTNLVTREAFWIKFMNAASINGLNTHKNPTSCYGYTYSEVTRQRLREANLGKVTSQKTRDKISKALRGKKKSSEHIANAANALRGRKLSEEVCKAMSDRRKGIKLPQHTHERSREFHLGRPLSEEHKRKISIGNAGKKLTTEQKLKVSLGLTGKVQSAETIAKRVAKNTGKKRTPEQRERMRQAHLEMHARKKLEGERTK